MIKNENDIVSNMLIERDQLEEYIQKCPGSSTKRNINRHRELTNTIRDAVSVWRVVWV